MLSRRAVIFCAALYSLRVMIGGWGGFGGPDPLVRWDGPGATGFLGGAAVDHVAGVFGVGQDLVHGELRPLPTRRRRVLARVGGQPGGDGGDAQALGHPPGEDLGYGGGGGRVKDQAGLVRPWAALTATGCGTRSPR